MPIVKFIGRVIPEHANVTLAGLPRFQWDEPDTNFKGIISIKIIDGDIDAECDINPYDTETAIRHTLRVARTLVDMISFCTAISLFVQFDEIVTPDGDRRKILVQDKGLVELCRAYTMASLSSEVSQPKILGTILEDSMLWKALRDLADTLGSADLAAINCARAIEIIRHQIAPGATKAQGWTILRKMLNIHEPYLKSITSHSEGPRHGDPDTPPWKETEEIRRRAWIIMDRFLEYRKRGNTLALPHEKFPLLTL